MFLSSSSTTSTTRVPPAAAATDIVRATLYILPVGGDAVEEAFSWRLGDPKLTGFF